MTDLHNGSDGLYRPPGLPLPITRDTILNDFAGKLTVLDDRNVRLNGLAVSLQDPRDIVSTLYGLAQFMLQVGPSVEFADQVGAQALALRVALARVEELDITSGDAA